MLRLVSTANCNEGFDELPKRDTAGGCAATQHRHMAYNGPLLSIFALLSLMEAPNVLISWVRTATHMLCWLSVKAYVVVQVRASRKREKKVYEGQEAKPHRPSSHGSHNWRSRTDEQAHHWQVACDVSSDEHQRNRKAEEARRKAVPLAWLTSKLKTSANSNIHFVCRCCVALRHLTCPLWMRLNHEQVALSLHL